MAHQPTHPTRQSAYRPLVVICICGVLLFGSVGAVAAGSAPDASLRYENGVVTTQNDRTYLWYDSPRRISVELPAVENDTSVCLVLRPTYSNETNRVDCVEPAANASGPPTVQFQSDQWPGPAAGSFQLLVVTRQTGTSGDGRRVHAERVVVLRKDGDVDGDGLANVVERRGLTNFTDSDTDDDGLQDGAEVNEYGTSPVKADTDGDGFRDGVEVFFGTEPTESQSNVSALDDSIDTKSTDGSGQAAEGSQAAESGQANEELVPQPRWASGKLPPWVDRYTVGAAALMLLAVLFLLRGVVLTAWDRLLGRQPKGDQTDPLTTSADGGTTKPSPDEAYVIRLLQQEDGRLQQAEIVEESEWSKAKVSRVLSRLEASDRIEKEHVGRRNVIVLSPDD